LRTALEADSTLMVIGDADTIGKAVQVGERLQPTVAILASALPDGTALDLCARFQIVTPETRTVILARDLDTVTVVDAVRAGVAGYLTNHVARDELCRAVRVIASGDVMMDPVSTRALLDGVRRDGARDMPDGTMPLAAQERRVLTLVAQGKTNKEIAVELGLSDKTVKNYLSHAFEKLNVSRRAQAAVLFSQISRSFGD
jgi:two-component system, NarL family, response regulator DevR